MFDDIIYFVFYRMRYVLVSIIGKFKAIAS